MKQGVVAAGIATIIGSSFQFGYGSGILNNLEGALKDLYDKSGTSANISPWSTAWSLTTGFWCVGGFIGSIGGGPASNYLGRKWTIILTNIFTLTGVFLEVYPMGFYPFGANVTKVNLKNAMNNVFERTYPDSGLYFLPKSLYNSALNSRSGDNFWTRSVFPPSLALRLN